MSNSFYKKLFGLICATVLVVHISQAQTPSAKQDTHEMAQGTVSFAIASIKPNQAANGRWRLVPSPNGYSAEGISLRMLIMEAYSIYDPKRILGVQDWMTSEKYDVEARADTELTSKPDLDIDRNKSMLRSLLAERFNLVVHDADQTLPIYNLLIAKNGPKLKSAIGHDASQDPAEHSPRVVRSRSGQLSVEGFTMTDFAQYLSKSLDRPVIDKTGLTGQYAFSIQWNPKPEQMPRLSDGTSGVGGGPLDEANSLPSIYTALTEELGLKLVSTSGKVRCLVVDRAERPSAN